MKVKVKAKCEIRVFFACVLSNVKVKVKVKCESGVFCVCLIQCESESEGEM